MTTELSINQPIVLTGDGYKVSILPEALKLKKSLIATSLKVQRVGDGASDIIAADAIRDLGSLRISVEKTRELVTKPLLEKQREIKRLADEFLSDARMEEERVKGLRGAYTMEVSRKQQEIQRQAEEARRKAEQAEREAQAKRDAEEAARLRAENAKGAMAEAKAEAEQAKARIAAEKLEREEDEKRRQAHALEQQAKEQTVKGARMAWDFEVLDLHELYRNTPQLVTMEPRRREIIEALNSMERNKTTVELPGLRVFQKPVVSAR